MKAVAEFRVPSLAEGDADYGAMTEKLAHLSHEQAVATHAADDLAADIRSRPAPRINIGVAEALGEVVDKTLFERPRKLAELRQRAADYQRAGEIVRGQIISQQGPASVKVCKAVRPEYARRLKAFVAAVEAAADLYRDVESLLDDLENEGVGSSYLPVVAMPAFTKHNGAVERFITEARTAGYV